jgi:hypothetical protein
MMNSSYCDAAIGYADGNYWTMVLGRKSGVYDCPDDPAPAPEPDPDPDPAPDPAPEPDHDSESGGQSCEELADMICSQCPGMCEQDPEMRETIEEMCETNQMQQCSSDPDEAPNDNAGNDASGTADTGTSASSGGGGGGCFIKIIDSLRYPLH